ncbi:PEP-CTERM sorting domain-containing protein [Thalassotalea hakodatensis]|uniref:PEP-CTERM sorting domain-containing protein n=1 Tax=Thalassotalea hakodatensis TaxID=3030492 RepID=UPI00257393DA|nr:PEP-CTERM sorting domain-containing protein [Thalassotalea hakodatensis]
MNIKKGLAIGLAALGLSLSAQASDINVGGVVWDPDSVNSFPAAEDFFSSGNLFENFVTQPGDMVNGFGIFTQMNSDSPNGASFCPGCELTFTFSMELVSFTPTSGNDGDFEFKDLAIDIFVDHTPDYSATAASASGTPAELWLSLVADGFLTGSATDFGTGSDTGTGSALLNVTGGLAAGNFDTNGEFNGTDMVLSSSFQPGGPNGLLKGGFELTGNSIPEPASIALLGLGMLGFAASRKRKA